MARGDIPSRLFFARACARAHTHTLTHRHRHTHTSEVAKEAGGCELGPGAGQTQVQGPAPSLAV